MKFKALTVKNFQRHKSLLLTFDPRITSIQGATDAGKSSLLRALRWICLNDFSGSDFVREGSKQAEVSLTVRHQKEDHHLSRSKGERVNVYELGEKEYKAFATNVPEDISGLLRLNEINFQSQHDAPFWFNETAGEVSRRLNAVVDLSVIDTVLSTAAALVRESESMARICEQRLADLQESQVKLDPQLVRISHYEKLKAQHEAHETQKETSDHLASLLEQCCAHQTNLARLQLQIQASGTLRKRFFLGLQQGEQLATLRQLAIEGERLQRIRRPPEFNSVVECYHQARSTGHQVSLLADLVGKVGTVGQTIETALQESKAAALVFHRATKGERCPTCNQMFK